MSQMTCGVTLTRDCQSFRCDKESTVDGRTLRSRFGNVEDVSPLSGLLLVGEGTFMLCTVSAGFQKSGCDAPMASSPPGCGQAEECLEGAQPLGQHHFPFLLYRL